MRSLSPSWSALLVLAALGPLTMMRSNEARGQEEAPLPRPLVPSADMIPATPSVTSFPTAGGKPYPINLPTAMKLGNARNLDIELASRRLQLAAAQLQGAKVLWLPNLIVGTDYYRHDGQIQDIAGNVFGTSKQGFMLGGAPYLVFSFADAIFQPLAVRQTVRAGQAQVQAAANDTLLALTQAYFNLQQARFTQHQKFRPCLRIIAQLSQQGARHHLCSWLAHAATAHAAMAGSDHDANAARPQVFP
jgi:outer membrane protein TolC